MTPVSSSAVCRHVRIVFVYSHLYQISFLCSRKSPLFPYTHAYSVIEPSVDVFNVIPHACYSVIVQPPSCIYLDFLKAWYLHYSVKLHFHFYGMKHPPAWEDLHSSHSDGRFYIYHVLRSKLAISLIIAIKPPSINIFTLSKFPFTDFIPQPIFCILTTIQD